MPPAPLKRELLSISQAAKLLGVSSETLRRWDRSGILPSLRTRGDQRRYRKEDLLEFARRTKPVRVVFRQEPTKEPKRDFSYRPTFSHKFLNMAASTFLLFLIFGSGLVIGFTLLGTSFRTKVLRELTDLLPSLLTRELVSPLVESEIKERVGEKPEAELLEIAAFHSPISFYDIVRFTTIASDLVPGLDDTYSLGSSSLEWKDLYLDGTAYIDNAEIDGLTVSGDTTIKNNLTVSKNINVGGISSDLIPSADGTYDLGSSTSEWQDLYVDGTANVDILRMDDDIVMADDNWIGLGGTSGRIVFDDQGTDEINILSANLGIRTGTPLETLDVDGRVHLSQTTTPATTTDRLYNVSGNLLWNGVNLTGGGALPSGTSGQTLYHSGAAWTASSNFYHDGTDVGIGTTSPGAALDVNGNILVQGGGSIDVRVTGTLTIGGTTQTGLTLGRSDQDTTINGGNIILGAVGDATNEAVRADRSLTFTQEAGGNVTITNSGTAQDFTANRSWTLGWTGLLAIARGGTNSNATPTAGAIAYGTGTAYAFNAAGTSGQLLTSGGAGVPTWTSQGSGGGLDADTLDTLDSLQFLRSDVSDNYTSGTLTFDNLTGLTMAAGSTLNVSAATFTLADNQVGWAKVSKTGSSLADLETRSILDTTGTLTVARGGTGSTSLTGMIKGNGVAAFSGVTGTTGYATYWLDNNTIAAEQYLAVSRGGTGAGTFTQYGVLYGNAANAIQVTAAGATGQVLIGNDGAAPSWGTVGASGITPNSLDFTEFQDTMDLDADLTLNQTTYTWVQNFTGDTTTGLTYNANSLTSGRALYAASTATAFTGTLVDIALTGNNAANTGTLFKVSSTGVLSTGTAAMITNLGVGLSFRVNDETGDGDTTPFVIDNSGNVGIGTTNPTDTLHVVGNILATSGIHIGLDGDGTLIDDASTGSTSTTLYIGNESILVSGDIGSSVQAYDAELTEIAALSDADSNFIVGNGSAWVVESGDTARTSLGLGTGDSPTLTGLTLSGLTAGVVHSNGSGVLSNVLGTANYLPKWDASGLTSTSTIYDDGNVGIGTTGPAYKLEVLSSDQIIARFTSPDELAAEIAIRNDDDTAYFGVGASSAYMGGTSGSSALNLNVDVSTGSVGIGTVGPAAKLDVNYDEITPIVGNYYGVRSDTDSTGIFATAGQTTKIYGIYGDAAATGVSTAGTVNTYGGYFTATGEGTGAATTNAYGLYVNGATGADNNYSAVFMNGNVGIGTTSPDHLLHLLSTASYPTLEVQTNQISGGVIQVTGSQGGWQMVAEGPDFNIQEAGVGVKFHIETGGNVGIGTTGPNYPLQVNTSSSNIAIYGYNTQASTSNYGIYGQASGAGTTNYGVYGIANTATTNWGGYFVGQGYFSGNVGIGTTSPTAKLAINSGHVVTNGTYGFRSYGVGTAGDTNTEDLELSHSGTDGRIVVSKTGSGSYRPLTFYTSGAEKVRIDTDGNVGIGTTGPGQKLVISASENNTALGNNTAAVARIINTYTADFGRRSELQFGMGGEQQKRQLALIAAEYITWNPTTGAEGALIFGTKKVSDVAVSERVRIDGSGNVGIGTTNPGAKLDVNGSLIADSIVSDSYMSPYYIEPRYYTTETNSTTQGQWTKILEFDFNGATYSEATTQFFLLGRTREGNDPITGFVELTLNTTSGGDLTGVRIRMSEIHRNDNVGKDDLVLVDTSVSGTAEGAVYLRINSRYDRAHILPIYIYGQGATFNFLSDQGFLASLPAGTQSSAAYASQYFNSGYFDGNVGIGTTSPNKLLELYDPDGNTDVATMRIGMSSSKYWDIGALGSLTGDSDAGLDFSSNSTSNVLFLQRGGNVGIGTTGPGGKLEVQQAQNTNAATFTSPHLRLSASSTTDSGGTTAITLATSTVNNYGVSLAGLRAGVDGTPSFAIRTHLNSAVGNEVLRITNDGDVGIGTTVPDTMLHISGDNPDIKLTDSSNPVYYSTIETRTAEQTFTIKVGGTSILETHGYYDADELGLGVLGHANALYIDTNGNVGIGTTVPGTNLHVLGTGRTDIRVESPSGSDAVFALWQNGGEKGNFHYSNAGDYLGFWDQKSSSTAMVINNGKVGIGTTGPGEKLDVRGNTVVGNSAGDYLRLVTTATSAAGGLNNGLYVYKSGTTAYGLKLQYTGTEYGTMMFGPNQSSRFLSFGKVGAALEDDDMVEYMRIDLDNGDVGIGTTNPNYRLHIYETANNATKIASYFDFDISGTLTTHKTDRAVNIDMNSSAVGNQDTTQLNLQGMQIGITMTGETYLAEGIFNVINFNATSTLGTQRGIYNYLLKSSTGTITNAYGSHNIIDSHGAGGQITNAYGVYSHINQAVGGTIDTSYAYYARQDRDAGTSNTAYLYYGTFEGTHTTKWGLYLTGETKNYFSGNVGIGRTPAANKLEVEGDASKTVAGDWAANSDIRIKTDVQNIDNALDVINQLRPVKFKYTDEYMAAHPSIEDRYYYNFIAQEFAQVFPDSVKDNGEGLLQLDAYVVRPYLVKAIQEQQEQLTEIRLVAQDSWLVAQDNKKRLDEINLTDTGDVETKALNPLVEASSSDPATLVEESTEASPGAESTEASPSSLLSQYSSEQLASSLDSLTQRIDILEQLLFNTNQEATLSANLQDTSAIFDTGEEEDIKIDQDLALYGNLNVLGKTVVDDLGITGKITAGLLTIDGLEAEINTLSGPLKLQVFGLGNVDIFDGKIVMTPEGNLHLKEGVIYANDEMRSSETVTAGIKEIRVDREWDEAPVVINTTPSWNTVVWVTDISESGFTAHFDTTSSAEEKVYWMAIW